MITATDDELELQTELNDDEEAIGSLEHGAIGSTLIMYLNQYVRANKLGRVFDAQTTFMFMGKKPNRQPDVAFVSANRLPTRWDEEADFLPDFAAEIDSKNDKIFQIHLKVKQYQKSGVRLVWIIHPVIQTVDVFRFNTGVKSETFAGDDELSGEEVIQGFKVKVSDLFEGIPLHDDDEY